MLKKYLMIFLVSMVPLIELRGAVPIAVGMNLPLLPSYIICILGNMLPVPIIFFFARKVLEWGADKQVIGKGLFSKKLEMLQLWRIRKKSIQTLQEYMTN